MKGVPIAAFEKRNPVLSIWSVYTLITLIPMMHLLLVLDNFDLCLLGRQGEAVASHHFVGLRIFGCLFLFSGPVSLWPSLTVSCGTLALEGSSLLSGPL